MGLESIWVVQIQISAWWGPIGMDLSQILILIFWIFFKFWVICFPTNYFKAKKTFYDENYIETSYVMEDSE